MPSPQNFSWDEDANDNPDLEGLPDEKDEVVVEQTQVAYDPETGMRNEDGTSEVVDEIYEEAPRETPQLNKAMSRIQKAQDRLDMAHCYRLLLENSMFDVDTPAARKVDAEVRDFVCQRLEVLMGVQPEPAAQKALPRAMDVFSAAEIQVLKTVAKRVIEKSAESKPAEPPVAPAAPALKKVTLPEQTQPRPAVQQQAPEQRPQLPQRRQLPQPQLRKPPGQQQPQRAQGQQPLAKIQFDMERIPEKYRDDPTLKIANGQAMIQSRTPEGDLLWEFDPKTKQKQAMMRNIALPAKPSGGAVHIPMPPIQQLMGPTSPVMQAHADGMMGTAERRANKLGIGGKFAGALISSVEATANNGQEDF